MTDSAHTSQAPSRHAGLRARRRLAPEFRAIASRQIVGSLRNLHYFKVARSVALYWPMPDEVDVRALIVMLRRRNRIACLPIMLPDLTLAFAALTQKTEFRRNSHGIVEPLRGAAAMIPARRLDLAVVPLSAFDDSANRIGMGAGYYDRTFEFLRHRRIWRRPRMVGVAFESQRVATIRRNPWDIRMDAVITEEAVYTPETDTGKSET